VRAENEIDRFWDWVDDDTPITEVMNLHLTIHHLQTFWNAREEPNVVLLHYNDLQADLDGEMRRLAGRLDIAIDDARWLELVEAARFENMRANADVVAPDTSNGIWNSNTQFFNRGSSGQWREILDEDDLARYDRRVAELGSPDLIRWMHEGALESGARDPA
jgi:aryl sulfotransferase